MDRLEAMATLIRVVDTGSFSGASRALRMPLTTVSRKINELEAHLGTRLLLRTTRKVALTDAGAVYVASARRILEQIDESERIAAGEFRTPRGDLVLTAPLFFGRLHVLPIVTDFLVAYPEINVRLLLSDRNRQLLDEHIDLAARIGTLPDSSMVATRVGSMRTVVCASPHLIAAHGIPGRPEDITTLPSIAFHSRTSAATWPFRTKDNPTGTFDVPIHPRLSVTSAEAAVSAAVQGTGITRVLYYQCADAVRDGALRIVLTDWELAPLPVHLIHASRGTLPSKMRVFLDFAAARLKERLASL